MSRKASSEFQNGEDVIRAIRGASVDGIAPATDEDPRLYYYGMKFFGNWSLACEAAGVQGRSLVQKTRREWAILGLRRLYEAEGVAPRASEQRRLWEQVERLFGSWNEALKVAGIPIDEVNKVMANQEFVKQPSWSLPDEGSDVDRLPPKCKDCLWRMGLVCPTPSCIKGWEDGNYQKVIGAEM